MRSLRESKFLARYVGSQDHPSKLQCVLHLTNPDVAASEIYSDWMSSLKGQPTHVLANGAASGYRQTVFPSSAWLRVGLPLHSNGKEMMVAFVRWLGHGSCPMS